MTTLAIRELTISHFRSHKLARLEFDPGPVAIFGTNGAGKTNLLEAVSLLSPGRGLRRATADDMIRKSDTLGWKIKSTLQSLHQIHEVETWAEPATPRQTRIDGKAATQTALGRIARILWLVPAMDRLWTDGADGRRRFLDRMTLSFEPGHGQAVLDYEKAMRERNKLLKERVDDPSWYAALENRMATAGGVIMENRQSSLERVGAAQEGAKTAFPRSDLTLLGPDGEAPVTNAAELAAGYSEGRHRDMPAGRTLTGPHRSDLAAIYTAKGVPARQCSTGEQKALLISLILANARALADDFGAPPILLLDEIAAHLDADRRAALYDEICALKAQAFLTGTGAELFDGLQNRAQFLEVQEGDGTSAIKST